MDGQTVDYLVVQFLPTIDRDPGVDNRGSHPTRLLVACSLLWRNCLAIGHCCCKQCKDEGLDSKPNGFELYPDGKLAMGFVW